MKEPKKEKREQMPDADPESEKGKTAPATSEPEESRAAEENASAGVEQETEPSAADTAQADDAGEGAAPEKTLEKSTAGNPAEDAPAPEREAEGGSETAKLTAALLAARSQLAAYAAGVSPDMIQDAVTLATAEAQAVGEVTEEAVAKAMADVLKRHPEWKASGSKQKSGGFKLGADPDSAGQGKGAKSENNGNKKRWNRFK